MAVVVDNPPWGRDQALTEVQALRRVMLSAMPGICSWPLLGRGTKDAIVQAYIAPGGGVAVQPNAPLPNFGQPVGVGDRPVARGGAPVDGGMTPETAFQYLTGNLVREYQAYQFDLRQRQEDALRHHDEALRVQRERHAAAMAALESERQQRETANQLQETTFRQQIGLLTADIERLTGQRDNHQEAANAADEARQKMDEEIERLKKQNGELTGQLDQLRQEKDRVSTLMHQAVNRREEALKLLATARQEVADAQNDPTAAASLQERDARIQLLEGELAGSKDTEIRLQGEIQRLRSHEALLENTIRELEANARIMAQDRNAAAQAKSQAESRVTKLEAQVETLNAQLGKAVDSMSDLDKKLRLAYAELRESKAAHRKTHENFNQAISDYNAANVRIGELEQDLAIARSSSNNDTLQQELVNAQRQLAEAKDRERAIQEELDRRMDEIQDNATALAERQKEVDELHKQLANERTRHTTLVQAGQKVAASHMDQFPAQSADQAITPLNVPVSRKMATPYLMAGQTPITASILRDPTKRRGGNPQRALISDNSPERWVYDQRTPQSTSSDGSENNQSLLVESPAPLPPALQGTPTVLPVNNQETAALPSINDQGPPTPMQQPVAPPPANDQAPLAPVQPVAPSPANDQAPLAPVQPVTPSPANNQGTPVQRSDLHGTPITVYDNDEETTAPPPVDNQGTSAPVQPVTPLPANNQGIPAQRSDLHDTPITVYDNDEETTAPPPVDNQGTSAPVQPVAPPPFNLTTSPQRQPAAAATPAMAKSPQLGGSGNTSGLSLPSPSFVEAFGDANITPPGLPRGYRQNFKYAEYGKAGAIPLWFSATFPNKGAEKWKDLVEESATSYATKTKWKNYVDHATSFLCMNHPTEISVPLRIALKTILEDSKETCKTEEDRREFDATYIQADDHAQPLLDLIEGMQHASDWTGSKNPTLSQLAMAAAMVAHMACEAYGTTAAANFVSRVITFRANLNKVMDHVVSLSKQASPGYAVFRLLQMTAPRSSGTEVSTRHMGDCQKVLTALFGNSLGSVEGAEDENVFTVDIVQAIRKMKKQKYQRLINEVISQHPDTTDKPDENVLRQLYNLSLARFESDAADRFDSFPASFDLLRRGYYDRNSGDWNMHKAEFLTAEKPMIGQFPLTPVMETSRQCQEIVFQRQVPVLSPYQLEWMHYLDHPISPQRMFQAYLQYYCSTSYDDLLTAFGGSGLDAQAEQFATYAEMVRRMYGDDPTTAHLPIADKICMWAVPSGAYMPTATQQTPARSGLNISNSDSPVGYITLFGETDLQDMPAMAATMGMAYTPLPDRPGGETPVDLSAISPGEFENMSPDSLARLQREAQTPDLYVTPRNTSEKAMAAEDPLDTTSAILESDSPVDRGRVEAIAIDLATPRPVLPVQTPAQTPAQPPDQSPDQTPAYKTPLEKTPFAERVPAEGSGSPPKQPFTPQREMTDPQQAAAPKALPFEVTEVVSLNAEAESIKTSLINAASKAPPQVLFTNGDNMNVFEYSKQLYLLSAGLDTKDKPGLANTSVLEDVYTPDNKKQSVKGKEFVMYRHGSRPDIFIIMKGGNLSKVARVPKTMAEVLDVGSMALNNIKENNAAGFRMFAQVTVAAVKKYVDHRKEYPDALLGRKKKLESDLNGCLSGDSSPPSRSAPDVALPASPPSRSAPDVALPASPLLPRRTRASKKPLPDTESQQAANRTKRRAKQAPKT